MSIFINRLRVAVADSFPMEEGETFDAYVARAIDVLSADQRAMLATRMHAVSLALSAERQQRKTEWIAEARLRFVPGYRQPCCVCGEFKSIAQAHHVVPLAAQFDRGFQWPDHDYVWLCPNHHTILHLLLPSDGMPPQKIGRRAAGPVCDLRDGELEVLLGLVARSGRRS